MEANLEGMQWHRPTPTFWTLGTFRGFGAGGHMPTPPPRAVHGCGSCSSCPKAYTSWEGRAGPGHIVTILHGLLVGTVLQQCITTWPSWKTGLAWWDLLGLAQPTQLSRAFGQELQCPVLCIPALYKSALAGHAGLGRVGSGQDHSPLTDCGSGSAAAGTAQVDAAASAGGMHCRGWEKAGMQCPPNTLTNPTSPDTSHTTPHPLQTPHNPNPPTAPATPHILATPSTKNHWALVPGYLGQHPGRGHTTVLSCFSFPCTQKEPAREAGTP